MILPDKHIDLSNSLIGAGSILIKQLKYPRTVTNLWQRVKDEPAIYTFERFGLALALLYVLGILDIENDLLRRIEK